MKPSRWLRFNAAVVLGSFLFTTFAAPYAEASFWTERRRAADSFRKSPSENASSLIAQLPKLSEHSLSALSAAPAVAPAVAEDPARLAARGIAAAPWLSGLVTPYGEIQSAFAGRPDGPWIVLVEDLHASGEAQRNISGLIGSLGGRLAERGTELTVGLEGAWGRFDLSAHRLLADEPIRGQVADYLLQSGVLTGAEHAALVAPQPMRVVGLEDRPLYETNVRAYKDSLALRAGFAASHAGLRSALEARKAAVYPPAALAWDRSAAAYGRGELPLGGFIDSLSTVAGDLAKDYPAARRFKSVLEMESKLDFDRAARQRNEVITLLAAAMPEDELRGFTALALDYRLGAASYTEFYGALRRAAEKYGVEWPRYPELDSYLRYVLLASRIEKDRLFREVDEWRTACYDRLLTRPEEKQLNTLSEQLALAQRLSAFELNSREWGKVRGWDAELRELPSRLRAAVSDAPAAPRWSDEVAAFRAFYDAAELRNGMLVRNLLRESAPGAASVLVAGGFHTESLKALLREKGVSWVSVRPNLTRVDGLDNYLAVFTRSRTPLEQLFAGDSLFLRSPLALAPEAAEGYEHVRATEQGLFLSLTTVKLLLRALRETGAGMAERRSALRQITARAREAAKEFDAVGPFNIRWRREPESPAGLRVELGFERTRQGRTSPMWIELSLLPANLPVPDGAVEAKVGDDRFAMRSMDASLYETVSTRLERFVQTQPDVRSATTWAAVLREPVEREEYLSLVREGRSGEAAQYFRRHARIVDTEAPPSDETLASLRGDIASLRASGWWDEQTLADRFLWFSSHLAYWAVGYDWNDALAEAGLHFGRRGDTIAEPADGVRVETGKMATAAAPAAPESIRAHARTSRYVKFLGIADCIQVLVYCPALKAARIRHLYVTQPDAAGILARDIESFRSQLGVESGELEAHLVGGWQHASRRLGVDVLQSLEAQGVAVKTMEITDGVDMMIWDGHQNWYGDRLVAFDLDRGTMHDMKDLLPPPFAKSSALHAGTAAEWIAHFASAAWRGPPFAEALPQILKAPGMEGGEGLLSLVRQAARLGAAGLERELKKFAPILPAAWSAFVDGFVFRAVDAPEARALRPVLEALDIEFEKQLKLLTARGLAPKLGGRVVTRAVEADGVLLSDKRFIGGLFLRSPDGGAVFRVHRSILEVLNRKDGRKKNELVRSLVERELVLQVLLDRGYGFDEAHEILETNPPADLAVRPPAVYSEHPRALSKRLREGLGKVADLMRRVPPAISVFGGNRVDSDSPAYKQGVELGRLMYRRGFVPRTGGGPGLMEAVLKGYVEEAEKAGDKSARVQAFKMEIATQPPNKYAREGEYAEFTHFIPRKLSLIENTHGLVVAPGGFGTLDELFDAWRTHRRLVLLGTDYWKPIIDAMYDSWERYGLAGELGAERPLVTDSLDEAIDYIAANGHGPNAHEYAMLLGEDAENRIDEIERTLTEIQTWQPAVQILGSSHLKADRVPRLLQIAGRAAAWATERGLAVRVGGRGPVTDAVLAGFNGADPSLLQGAFLTEDLDATGARDKFRAGKLLETTDRVAHKLVLTENALAYVVLPGRLGTWDLVSDLVDQMQTGQIPERPLVLVGKDFWEGTESNPGPRRAFVDAALSRKLIVPGKENLLQVVDTERELVDALASIAPKSAADSAMEFATRQEALFALAAEAVAGSQTPWWKDLAERGGLGVADLPRLLDGIFSGFYWTKVASLARVAELLDDPSFPKGPAWDDLLSGRPPAQRREVEEWLELLRTRRLAVRERAQAIRLEETLLVDRLLKREGNAVSLARLRAILRTAHKWGVEKREEFIGGTRRNGVTVRFAAGWKDLGVRRDGANFEFDPSTGDSEPLRALFWWQTLLDAEVWRAEVGAGAAESRVAEHLSGRSLIEDRMIDWQKRMDAGADPMKIAFEVADLPVNPSAKNHFGAVLVSADGRLIGAGFNHAPHGQGDDVAVLGGDPRFDDILPKGRRNGHLDFRDERLDWRRSPDAEKQAVLSAIARGESLVGARLYVTRHPCHQCAVYLQNTGIKEVVSPESADADPLSAKIESELEHLHAPVELVSLAADDRRAREGFAYRDALVNRRAAGLLAGFDAKDWKRLPVERVREALSAENDDSRLLRFLALRKPFVDAPPEPDPSDELARAWHRAEQSAAGELRKLLPVKLQLAYPIQRQQQGRVLAAREKVDDLLGEWAGDAETPWRLRRIISEFEAVRFAGPSERGLARFERIRRAAARLAATPAVGARRAAEAAFFRDFFAEPDRVPALVRGIVESGRAERPDALWNALVTCFASPEPRVRERAAAELAPFLKAFPDFSRRPEVWEQIRKIAASRDPLPEGLVPAFLANDPDKADQVWAEAELILSKPRTTDDGPQGFHAFQMLGAVLAARPDRSAAVWSILKQRLGDPEDWQRESAFHFLSQFLYPTVRDLYSPARPPLFDAATVDEIVRDGLPLIAKELPVAFEHFDHRASIETLHALVLARPELAGRAWAMLSGHPKFREQKIYSALLLRAHPGKTGFVWKNILSLMQTDRKEAMKGLNQLLRADPGKLEEAWEFIRERFDILGLRPEESHDLIAFALMETIVRARPDAAPLVWPFLRRRLSRKQEIEFTPAGHDLRLALGVAPWMRKVLPETAADMTILVKEWLGETPHPTGDLYNLFEAAADLASDPARAADLGAFLAREVAPLVEPSYFALLMTPFRATTPSLPVENPETRLERAIAVFNAGGAEAAAELMRMGEDAGLHEETSEALAELRRYTRDYFAKQADPEEDPDQEAASFWKVAGPGVVRSLIVQKRWTRQLFKHLLTAYGPQKTEEFMREAGDSLEVPAIRETVTRLAGLDRNAFDPQTYQKIFELAAAYKGLGLADLFRQESAAWIDSDGRDGVALVRSLTRTLMAEFARSMGVAAPLDESRWHVPYLSKLFVGMASLRGSKPWGDVLREMVKATLEGRYEAFMTDLDQENPVGRGIARHNANVRRSLEAAGLNVEAWLRGAPKPGEFTLRERAAPDAAEAAAALQARLSLLWAALVRRRATDVAELAGAFERAGIRLRETGEPDLSDPGRLKELLRSGSLEEALLPVIRAGGNEDDTAELAFHLKEDVVLLREAFGLAATASRAGKKLVVKAWDRNPGRDLFQGNATECCIAIDSHMHTNALIAYLIDEGIQVVEVVDPSTRLPIGQAWVFAVPDPRTGRPHLIVDNIELKKEYARYGDQVRDAIAGYLTEWAASAGAGGVWILDTMAGAIPINDVDVRVYPKKIRRDVRKIGGFYGGKPYYLEALGRNAVREVWAARPAAGEEREIALDLDADAFAALQSSAFGGRYLETRQQENRYFALRDGRYVNGLRLRREDVFKRQLKDFTRWRSPYMTLTFKKKKGEESAAQVRDEIEEEVFGDVWTAALRTGTLDTGDPVVAVTAPAARYRTGQPAGPLGAMPGYTRVLRYVYERHLADGTPYHVELDRTVYFAKGADGAFAPVSEEFTVEIEVTRERQAAVEEDLQRFLASTGVPWKVRAKGKFNALKEAVDQSRPRGPPEPSDLVTLENVSYPGTPIELRRKSVYSVASVAGSLPYSVGLPARGRPLTSYDIFVDGKPKGTLAFFLDEKNAALVVYSIDLHDEAHPEGGAQGRGIGTTLVHWLGGLAHERGFVVRNGGTGNPDMLSIYERLFDGMTTLDVRTHRWGPYDPAAVRTELRQANVLVYIEGRPRAFSRKPDPRPLFFTAGGTIEMRGAAGRRGGAAASVGRHTALFDEVLDSGVFRAEHWRRIIKAVAAAAESGQPVVLTHGTDTLEDTAFILSLLFNGRLKKPLVITGAWTPPDQPGSDADSNVANAARLSLDPAAPPLVYVVIGDEIHLGSRARKARLGPDGGASYFESAGGPVGRIDAAGRASFDPSFLEWARTFRPREELGGGTADFARVEVAFDRPDVRYHEDLWARFRSDGRPGGVVFLGDVPPAADDGAVVWLTRGDRAGLDPFKAALKLSLLLGAGLPAARARLLMRTDFAGELAAGVAPATALESARVPAGLEVVVATQNLDPREIADAAARLGGEARQADIPFEADVVRTALRESDPVLAAVGAAIDRGIEVVVATRADGSAADLALYEVGQMLAYVGAKAGGKLAETLSEPQSARRLVIVGTGAGHLPIGGEGARRRVIDYVRKELSEAAAAELEERTKPDASLAEVEASLGAIVADMFSRARREAAETLGPKAGSLEEIAAIELVDASELPELVRNRLEAERSGAKFNDAAVAGEFAAYFAVRHKGGGVTYVARHQRTFTDNDELDDLTYFVDVREGALAGRGVMKYEVNNEHPHYKEKPSVDYNETFDGNRRQGFALRRLRLMNVFSEMFYGIPLYSDRKWETWGEDVWKKLVRLGEAEVLDAGTHNKRYVFKPYVPPPMPATIIEFVPETLFERAMRTVRKSDSYAIYIASPASALLDMVREHSRGEWPKIKSSLEKWSRSFEQQDLRHLYPILLVLTAMIVERGRDPLPMLNVALPEIYGNEAAVFGETLAISIVAAERGMDPEPLVRNYLAISLRLAQNSGDVEEMLAEWANKFDFALSALESGINLGTARWGHALEASSLRRAAGWSGWTAVHVAGWVLGGAVAVFCGGNALASALGVLFVAGFVHAAAASSAAGFRRLAARVEELAGDLPIAFREGLFRARITRSAAYAKLTRAERAAVWLHEASPWHALGMVTMLPAAVWLGAVEAKSFFRGKPTPLAPAPAPVSGLTVRDALGAVPIDVSQFPDGEFRVVYPDPARLSGAAVTVSAEVNTFDDGVRLLLALDGLRQLGAGRVRLVLGPSTADASDAWLKVVASLADDVIIEDAAGARRPSLASPLPPVDKQPLPLWIHRIVYLQERFADSAARAAAQVGGTADFVRVADDWSVALPDVAGRNIVLIHSTHDPANLVKLLLTLVRLREAGAASVSLLNTYEGYARQDKAFKPGDVVSAETFLRLINRFVDHRFAINVHYGGMSGVTGLAGETLFNLNAFPQLAEHLFYRAVERRLGVNPARLSAAEKKALAPRLRDEFGSRTLLVVAPDDGAFHYAAEAADVLRRRIEKDFGVAVPVRAVYLDKVRKSATEVEIHGPFHGEGGALVELSPAEAGQALAFVLDDETAQGSTLLSAVYVLVEEMGFAWPNTAAGVVQGKFNKGLAAFDTGLAAGELETATRPAPERVDAKKRRMPPPFVVASESLPLPAEMDRSQMVSIQPLITYLVKRIIGRDFDGQEPPTGADSGRLAGLARHIGAGLAGFLRGFGPGARFAARVDAGLASGARYHAERGLDLKLRLLANPDVRPRGDDASRALNLFRLAALFNAGGAPAIDLADREALARELDGAAFARTDELPGLAKRLESAARGRLAGAAQSLAAAAPGDYPRAEQAFVADLGYLHGMDGSLRSAPAEDADALLDNLLSARAAAGVPAPADGDYRAVERAYRRGWLAGRWSAERTVPRADAEWNEYFEAPSHAPPADSVTVFDVSAVIAEPVPPAAEAEVSDILSQFEKSGRENADRFLERSVLSTYSPSDFSRLDVQNVAARKVFRDAEQPHRGMAPIGDPGPLYTVRLSAEGKAPFVLHLLYAKGGGLQKIYAADKASSESLDLESIDASSPLFSLARELASAIRKDFSTLERASRFKPEPSRLFYQIMVSPTREELEYLAKENPVLRHWAGLLVRNRADFGIHPGFVVVAEDEDSQMFVPGFQGAGNVYIPADHRADEETAATIGHEWVHILSTKWIEVAQEVSKKSNGVAPTPEETEIAERYQRMVHEALTNGRYAALRRWLTDANPLYPNIQEEPADFSDEVIAYSMEPFFALTEGQAADEGYQYTPVVADLEYYESLGLLPPEMRSPAALDGRSAADRLDGQYYEKYRNADARTPAPANGPLPANARRLLQRLGDALASIDALPDEPAKRAALARLHLRWIGPVSVPNALRALEAHLRSAGVETTLLFRLAGQSAAEPGDKIDTVHVYQQIAGAHQKPLLQIVTDNLSRWSVPSEGERLRVAFLEILQEGFRIVRPLEELEDSLRGVEILKIQA